jgi:putative methionine-R-sulfoxide reductase with GAF domain
VPDSRPVIDTRPTHNLHARRRLDDSAPLAAPSYGAGMSPPKPRQSPPTAEQEERLAAVMNPTVILTATAVESSRAAAERQVDEWAQCDPPTAEPEILAAVHRTHEEIESGQLTPAAVMDLVCRRAQFLTDAAGAVVELLEGTELVYRAAAGSAARSLGLRVDTHRSLSGLCLRTAEAVRCDDTERDDRVDKAACRWVGIRSMAIVPVVRDGRAGGVLAVISAGTAGFGDRAVWTLQRLAEVLADALGPGPFQAGAGPAAGVPSK